MKQLLTVFLFSSGLVYALAQESFQAYDPSADASSAIKEAVSKAHDEKKHVFIQIGGNWCGWCKLFHDLVNSDQEINDYLHKNYEVVYLNYSKENKNLDVLATLDYPQRFGFPVFVILDENGTRIHTQSSGYLEEGKGHSRTKVLEFLQQWSVGALNPELYE